MNLFTVEMFIAFSWQIKKDTKKQLLKRKRLHYIYESEIMTHRFRFINKNWTEITLEQSAKRFEKQKEKNSFAARGLARSMGDDHDDHGHGTGDSTTEFPIHPMRASGQCPDTIPDLGKTFLVLTVLVLQFLLQLNGIMEVVKM